MVQEGATTPAIEARAISKHFGHVVALDRVDLTLQPGEVLGVVGDNGAGKSTLMKILAGLFPPSDGELLIAGEAVQLGSPADARQRGIEMVYQDLALAGNLRIDENIFLGREQVRRIGPLRLVDHGANMARAKEHLDKLRIHVKSVTQRVEELSGGQRQAVAIARATAFDARVVIMDEPTAALAVKEVAKVLDLIKDLRNHGIGVILISHRLDDVFYVCDRVMALFHGRNFADAPLADVSRNDVIGWIMGNRTTDAPHVGSVAVAGGLGHG
jgi:simple sugar transport system ATP-binding protein